MGERARVPRPAGRDEPHPRPELDRDDDPHRSDPGPLAGAPGCRRLVHPARDADRLALVWAYVRYGGTPTGEALLYGIEPVVITIVVLALVKLGRTAAKRSPLLVITGLASLVLYLVGVNELILLLGVGLVVLVVQAGSRLGPGAARTIAPLTSAPSCSRLSSRTGPRSCSGGCSSSSSSSAPLCTGAGMCSSPSSGVTWWIGWGGSRSTSWSTRLPSGSSRRAGVHSGEVHRVPRRRDHRGLLATAGIFLPAFVFVGLLSHWCR